MRREPPSLRHVLVARRITRALEHAAPAGYDVLPEAGWLVQPRSVYVPDVMVAARQGTADADLLRIAPLLVVEILASATRVEDWGRKMVAYAGGGTDWYWIADAEVRELTIHRRTGGLFREERRLVSGQLVVREPIPVELDLPAIFA